MTNSSISAPDWLAEMFFEKGEPSPELLRHGRAQVWGSTNLIAKVHANGGTASGRAERELAVLAGTAVPVAHPQGEAESPNSLVTWWRRVRIARPATGSETLTWLRALHAHTPVPARQACLVLPVPTPDDTTKEFLGLLEPVLTEQAKAMHDLAALPGVFIHADANPTNIVVNDAGDTVGLDFELAGVGPRVFDIATVGVLLEETRSGTLEQALTLYGEQVDATLELTLRAATVVRANRIVVCALHPGWLAEGWDRLDAWREGRPYVFPVGAGPK